jgi:hypothetical protein
VNENEPSTAVDVDFLVPSSFSITITETAEGLSESTKPTTVVEADALSDITSPKKAPDKSIATASKAIRD